MYKKILTELIRKTQEGLNSQDFLLRDLFYIANKFIITSAFRTLIPRNTKGLYAFVEEGEFKGFDTNFIIRYLGRSDDIQKRLLQHEKDINKVLEKIRKKQIENSKYFQFAEKILSNPKSYAIYIWRWREPRATHKDVFSGGKIDLIDAEGIIGGMIGEVFGKECYNKEFVSRSVYALEKPNANFRRLNMKTKDNQTELNLDKWRKWCKINLTKKEIPLFEFNEETNEVLSITVGNGSKRILRQKEMEEIVSKEISKIYYSYIEDKNNFEFDGLIYMMYTLKKDIVQKDIIDDSILEKLDENDIIPFYIGKTETIGVNGKYSVNIKNVHKKLNKTKFARWGDGGAYHIGDLSDALLDNRKAENFKKYSKWAEFLFKKREMQSKDPVILKFPVYFGCKAWHKDDKGLILNLPCSTCFLERQLISLANIIFPKILLNQN